jgi:hypothetical protein
VVVEVVVDVVVFVEVVVVGVVVVDVVEVVVVDVVVVVNVVVDVVVVGVVVVEVVVVVVGCTTKSGEIVTSPHLQNAIPMDPKIKLAFQIFFSYSPVT